MDAKHSQGSKIYMGHGQMVDLIAQADGSWELVFSEEGRADYKAPPLNEIKCDAIDPDAAVHSLTISAGPKPSSVIASGKTKDACRARVMVVHGDHFHTREGTLHPEAVKIASGPNGGSVIALSRGQVEVKVAGEGRIELTFLNNGVKTKAPASDNVAVEAIGPRSEDYQVRQLIVFEGGDEATLIASGKVGDADYVRLSVKNNGDAEIKSAPLVVA
jgi:hypothetical protein